MVLFLLSGTGGGRSGQGGACLRGSRAEWPGPPGGAAVGLRDVGPERIPVNRPGEAYGPTGKPISLCFGPVALVSDCAGGRRPRPRRGAQALREDRTLPEADAWGPDVAEGRARSYGVRSCSRKPPPRFCYASLHPWGAGTGVPCSRPARSHERPHDEIPLRPPSRHPLLRHVQVGGARSRDRGGSRLARPFGRRDRNDGPRLPRDHRDGGGDVLSN